MAPHIKHPQALHTLQLLQPPLLLDPGRARLGGGGGGGAAKRRWVLLEQAGGGVPDLARQPALVIPAQPQGWGGRSCELHTS